MPESIITANRLTDGVVVWLDQTDGWASDIAAAAVFDSASVPPMLQRAQDRDRNTVVDVREIPVELIEGRIVPTARRERLRAAGPSVRNDLAGTPPETRWAQGPLPPPLRRLRPLPLQASTAMTNMIVSSCVIVRASFAIRSGGAFRAS
ncbi:DUF2849 domain-containing protein [Pannonibacter phragmitetus]|uniref:DUF2849 domain-containing protein n=1 Tax=Pannonibacter phragmitetus TaxID=121719 RepID=UPI003D2EFFFA